MRVFFIALLMGVVSLVPSAAQSTIIDIGEQPPLLSKAGGIVNIVVEKALARTGYRVEFRWLPIGRMLALLEQSGSELYVTPSNTPGQENPHIDLLAARGVFFFKKSLQAGLVVTRLEDLAGKRVGTVTNSPLRPMFEKAGIFVDEGPFETMFDKLDSGRVDFTSTADVGGILTIKAKFPGRESEFSFTEYSYSEIRVGLYARNKPEYRAILEACRTGFEKMKEDGSLNLLLRDFFGLEHYRKVRIY